MQKYTLIWLLIFSLFSPVVAQNSIADRIKKSTIEHLEQIKSRLDVEVDEFKKCIKRDQSCDPMRKKIYITVATIGPILAAFATGTTIYLVKKKKKITKSLKPISSRTQSDVQSSKTTPIELAADPSASLQQQMPVVIAEQQPALPAVASVSPEESEGEESEGEEEYFSASSDDESGYESAEDTSQEEEKLKKSIQMITDTYTQNYILLGESIILPHARGIIEDEQLIKSIQQRQKQAATYFQQADNEQDLKKKLSLLKQALATLKSR